MPPADATHPKERRMTVQSRRTFNAKMLGAMTAYGLIAALFHNDLFGAAVKPVIARWLIELHDLGKAVKGHKLKDTEFQAKLEDLYRRVDLAELVKFLEVDRLAREVKFPALGAANLSLDLRQVEGLPERLVFGKQIFA